MKVQIENAGPVEKKIFFEIPSDVVSREVESTYRSFNHNVKLKGFRPGKVPRSILERYYKSQVENEVISKLIEVSYEKAVQDYHLAPVAPPTLVDQSFETGKEFKYTVSIEVKPEVVLEEYKGSEVERPSIQVSDEEVEGQLRSLQETHAQLNPVDSRQMVQEKDIVIVDFEGTLDGQPVEGWRVTNHLVEVGSKSLVGEFDQKLIGLPLQEEKVIPLTLPETYPRKELAGKEILIRLKIKEIKEKVLPPLDDELAKTVGDFKTLEELKARLRKNLEERTQAQADHTAKEKLLDHLREKHPFPVPKGLIERQVQTLMARAELQLGQQGMKLDDVDQDRQKLRESFWPRAEKEVRGSLILDKIAEMEKISVDETELDRRLEGLATQLNQRVEAVKHYYGQKDRLEDLRALMREEKTLAFLLSQAKIIPSKDSPPEKSEGAGVEATE